MRGRGVEQDWTVEDLDVLLHGVRISLDESLRCHQAGAGAAGAAQPGWRR